MDPHLIDLLWEVHREVGAKEAIWIICGYRSPADQFHAAAALERGRRVQPAHAGQGHRLLHSRRAAGAAARSRPAGAARRRGLLPDVRGTVRTYGHRQRAPLAAHAGGAARAACWRRGSSNPRRRKPTPQRSAPSLFARLFGGGRDEDEDARPRRLRRPSRAAQAATAPEARTDEAGGGCRRAESRVEKVAAAPLPQAKPVKPESYQVASAASKPVAKQIRPPRLRRSSPRRRATKSRRQHSSRCVSRGSGSGRAHRRVRKRHHQRAWLLAGTAEHRGRGRAASRQRARSGSRRPPRRRAPPAPIQRPRQAPLRGR